MLLHGGWLWLRRCPRGERFECQPPAPPSQTVKWPAPSTSIMLFGSRAAALEAPRFGERDVGVGRSVQDQSSGKVEGRLREGAAGPDRGILHRSSLRNSERYCNHESHSQY
jgi:hypothetical protein